MAVLPQTDPNVKIPAAVKAAAARSDEIFRSQFPQEDPAPTQDPATDVPPAEAALSPETTPPDATAAPAATEPVAGEENWEHKFKSMKGRFDQSQKAIRSLTERVTELQQQVNIPPVPRKTTAEKLITPAEEEQFGSEFLEVVGKKAKEEINPRVVELEHKFETLQAQVGGNAKQRMHETLTERCPNWLEINQTPEFLNWLDLPDKYSGAIRLELLKAAYERNDTPRVLNFFTGFLAEEAAVDPGRVEPNPAPAATPAPKIPLENLAAPGRAKTAATNQVPAEKPIFTRAQIAKFYAAVSAGAYSGREADKDALEAKIFEAQREGRIR